MPIRSIYLNIHCNRATWMKNIYKHNPITPDCALQNTRWVGIETSSTFITEETAVSSPDLFFNRSYSHHNLLFHHGALSEQWWALCTRKNRSVHMGYRQSSLEKQHDSGHHWGNNRERALCLSKVKKYLKKIIRKRSLCLSGLGHPMERWVSSWDL